MESVVVAVVVLLGLLLSVGVLTSGTVGVTTVVTGGLDSSDGTKVLVTCK